MATAKLFVNGRSQAVRLPKAFRFEGQREVLIEKEDDRVILRPVPRPDIGQWVLALEAFGDFPARKQPRGAQKRAGW